jgi:hypothetical protein
MSFTIRFEAPLGCKNVADVHELSLLDNEVHVRYDPDEEWLEIASLRRQELARRFVADDFDFNFTRLCVSDLRKGVGRYQLEGIVGAGAPELIWDNVESIHGDRSGIFVYARGGSDFCLDWVPDAAGWRYRSGGQVPVYSELLFCRYRTPVTAPRSRKSGLAA